MMVLCLRFEELFLSLKDTYLSIYRWKYTCLGFSLNNLAEGETNSGRVYMKQEWLYVDNC